LTEEISAYLKKARESITAAEILAQQEMYDFSISRAYYAMFYLAEALLLGEGLKYSKHGSVHAAFGEYFAKTEKLDPKYHRYLLDSFRERQTADYDVYMTVSPDESQQIIQQAKEFLKVSEEYFQKKQIE
jgi:uncharacterized protein (UPF0332 family)